MATFHLAVISPEHQAFDGEVASVSLRSEGGDIGFLAGHVPFIGVVRISVCEIVPAEHGLPQHLAVHGGFVEVAPDGSVTVLADIVERPEEIDLLRAQAARDRAAAAAGSGEDPEAQAALARAEVRLAVAAAGTGGAVSAAVSTAAGRPAGGSGPFG